MKAPVNILAPFDIDAIRNGDLTALGDAIQLLWNANNAQSVALATRIGTWQEVPYAAGNFISLDNVGAPAGSWAVSADDQRSFRYLRIDDLLIVHFDIQTTAVSGSPTFLAIRIPGGYITGPNEYGVMPIAIQNGAGAAFGGSGTGDAFGLGVVVGTEAALATPSFSHLPPQYIGCVLWPQTNWVDTLLGPDTFQNCVAGTVIFQIAPPAGN